MWVYKQERRPGMEIAKSRSRRYFFIDRCEPPTPTLSLHTVVPATGLFVRGCVEGICASFVLSCVSR